MTALIDADLDDQAGGRHLHTITANTIIPRRVRWLWAPGEAGHGRIPMGELTLIVGRGGVGKSTLLCTMAAWITIGDMQGEYYGHPRDVLYVTNEDSREYTVVPRLMAAGADLSRIHFVDVKAMDAEDRVLLPIDCERIEKAAQRVGAVAILLDPLVSNLAVENNNNQRQVRSAIEAVRRMCERAGMAAIGLAHTRKAASTNLMDAIMGSSELGNVCRSAMGVMADPDAEEEDHATIVLSHEKANLGRSDLDSYKYRIVSWRADIMGDSISTGRLEFLGKTDQRVSDILSDQASATTGIGDCVVWLSDLLMTEGEMERKEIIALAKKEGYYERALSRAKQRLRIAVRNSRDFPRRTIWSLPVTTRLSGSNEPPCTDHFS